MKFYRHLEPFKVISFDLDDTLYDNSEVIRAAEQNFVQQLSTYIQGFELAIWREWKQKIQQQQPILCEDVVTWRLETLRQLLSFHHKEDIEIEQISQQLMTNFIDWRHRISLPKQSLEVLKQLRDDFKLAVITNGNVEPKRIGLPDFDLVLRAGVDGRAKPHAELYQQTADFFGVKAHEVLHIGDNLITDVQGAVQAGCQAVWINLSGKQLADFTEARLLPHIEITDLTHLLSIAQRC